MLDQLNVIGLNLKKDPQSKLYPLRCLPQYAPLLTAPCLSSYSDQHWLFLCMSVIPPLVQIPSICVSGERWQRSHPSSIYSVIMRPFNSKPRICKHEPVDCSLTLYSFVSCVDFYFYCFCCLSSLTECDITVGLTNVVFLGAGLLTVGVFKTCLNSHLFCSCV